MRRYGTAGASQDPAQAATTALTFSNALRTFYSFIYRPTVETERELAHESNGQPYFIRRLAFSHDVAPIFGPYLFAPLETLVIALADGCGVPDGPFVEEARLVRHASGRPRLGSGVSACVPVITDD